MSNQALKYLTIAIFALAFLVWVGAGYLYFYQNPTPLNLSQIKLPQVNLSSLTWKTYQNGFLSFAFKYPPNLTNTNESPQEPQLYEWVSFYDAKQGSSEEALFSLQINQVSPSDHKIFNYASQATLDNPVTYEDKSNDGVKQQINLTPVSLNGINWVKADIKQERRAFQVYLVTQKKSPAVYTISLSGTADLLEDIVKTFSFIKT